LGKGIHGVQEKLPHPAAKKFGLVGLLRQGGTGGIRSAKKPAFARRPVERRSHSAGKK
jgi:hypothetical protein